MITLHVLHTAEYNSIYSACILLKYDKFNSLLVCHSLYLFINIRVSSVSDKTLVLIFLCEMILQYFVFSNDCDIDCTFKTEFLVFTVFQSFSCFNDLDNKISYLDVTW